ncbi:MAG: helix-turn-helix domain-containing protein [Pseudonocardiaceae bacterium]|nr:helix-turn-helix domain-containing protein [Pseudonocardiaceae bacterium]
MSALLGDFETARGGRTLPHKPYVVESRATTDVLPHERPAFWANAVVSLQATMGLSLPHPRAFHASYSRIGTDSYQLVAWKSAEARYARDSRHVRADPDEDYRLVFPIAGWLAVRQHDDVTYLRPGFGGVFSYQKPLDIWHRDDTQMMVLTIPRKEIENRINLEACQGATLDVSKGLGRVAQDLAAGVLRERSVLSRDQFEAASERLVELVCLLLVGDDRPNVSAALSEVETMARRYIRQHVDDPQLTGSTVAQALGWSLRQVQLALRNAGTSPRELIMEERLKAARERLRNPAYRNLTIGELAAQLGFSTAGNFSTAFRRRFGVRPRDLRQ